MHIIHRVHDRLQCGQQPGIGHGHADVAGKHLQCLNIRFRNIPRLMVIQTQGPYGLGIITDGKGDDRPYPSCLAC